MKKETSNFNVQTLRALAAQKIAALAESKHLVTTEPEQDELTSGEAVFLVRGVATANPNGKQFEIVMDSSGKELNRAELEKAENRKLFYTSKTELNRDLLFPFGVASADITVSPTENKLILAECERFDEVITVTVPKDSKRKIDIYFLADNTGSMGSYISAVQAGALSILAGVGATMNDLAYGVGNYRDFDDYDSSLGHQAFQHQLNPTNSAAAVTTAINNWFADGGDDTPEAQLYALDQLAEPAGGSIGWRTDSKRIIVWFGDEPGHDPICPVVTGLGYTITKASVIAKLTGENISVIAISVSNSPGADTLNSDPVSTSSLYPGCPTVSSPNQGSEIAAATAGSYAEGINATDIVNTIITLINSLVSVINNVSLVPSGATAPFVTYISPATGYGPLNGDTDHVLTFNVTFTGVKPCGDKDQLYYGSLDVVADGVVVAQKKVEIRVPACCKKRRYSYSVKYVIGRQERNECNTKLPVQTGNYTTEINIHNYQQKKAVIEKHIVPVIFNGEAIGREPKSSGIVADDKIVLAPYNATMDDTYRLAELLYKNEPPCNIPLNIGFLHIISNIQLAVTAVYTAGDTKCEQVSSIEVEEITGKEIPLEEPVTGGIPAR
jgi:hypothetical protein